MRVVKNKQISLVVTETAVKRVIAGKRQKTLRTTEVTDTRDVKVLARNPIIPGATIELSWRLTVVNNKTAINSWLRMHPIYCTHFGPWWETGGVDDSGKKLPKSKRPEREKLVTQRQQAVRDLAKRIDALLRRTFKKPPAEY